jgi:hypothetical protein
VFTYHNNKISNNYNNNGYHSFNFKGKNEIKRTGEIKSRGRMNWKKIKCISKTPTTYEIKIC